MLKVMHVLNTGAFSGAENVVITIINSMKTEIDSVYVALSGPIESVLYENDIKFYSVKKLSIIELRKAIKHIKPNIIHAHDFTAGIMCTATNTDIPIINHLHNNPPWIQSLNVRSLAYLIASNRFRRIYTVSKSIENEFKYANLLHNKILCIHNPIDINRIISLAQDSSEQLGDDLFKNYHPQVVFVGRLTEQKNPELLVTIFKMIIQRNPLIKIGIIGGGELYSHVRSELKLEIESGSVVMYGFVNNPYAIMKQAKALVLPSLWEGYGLVAVEALALGVPVVCSGAGGLNEIVNDDCGKICEYDKNQYVEELTALIDDCNYFAKKRQGALNRAKELDNLDRYIQIIRKDYLAMSKTN